MQSALRRLRHERTVRAAAASLAALGLACGGPEPEPTTPAATQELDGEVLYQANCAACHGMGARGDGRVATAFRKPPPDLTAIRASEGWFPRALVTMIVDGRYSAHGDKGMPVWGTFLSDAQITAVVGYLETLQQ